MDDVWPKTGECRLNRGYRGSVKSATVDLSAPPLTSRASDPMEPPSYIAESRPSCNTTCNIAVVFIDGVCLARAQVDNAIMKSVLVKCGLLVRSVYKNVASLFRTFCPAHGPPPAR